MKKVVISFGLLLLTVVASLSLWAQEPKKARVAVFDPTSTGQSIDEGTAVAVREMISSALVNTGKFNIVERSLLDKVMKEQKFSNSGAVDASQASELGKLAGANKVVVSVLSAAGARHMLSIKVIDVQSASVESQKIKTIKPAELLDIVESLTLELIGESAPAAKEESSFFGGLNSSRGKSAPKEEAPRPVKEAPYTPPAQSNKERFAERNDEDVAFSSSSQSGKDVTLEFSGYSYSKNPTVQLFWDGRLVGSGTLNQGFSIKFKDPNPGVHRLEAKWSATVAAKSFSINTTVKNYYSFDYVTTGFGYMFKLKE